MKIDNKAFYELMGDYHWDRCGYYWCIFRGTGDMESIILTQYHQNQGIRYDHLACENEWNDYGY